MVEQGRSVLTPDESGHVLDRLAGLEHVISPESVRQALSATGRCSQRACTLTHEVTLWIVLAMGQTKQCKIVSDRVDGVKLSQSFIQLGYRF